MDRIPVPVPEPKPVYIHTRGQWVRVLAGTGTDDLKFTHGLPVSNTEDAGLKKFQHDINNCQHSSFQTTRTTTTRTMSRTMSRTTVTTTTRITATTTTRTTATTRMMAIYVY